MSARHVPFVNNRVERVDDGVLILDPDRVRRDRGGLSMIEVILPRQHDDHRARRLDGLRTGQDYPEALLGVAVISGLRVRRASCPVGRRAQFAHHLEQQAYCSGADHDTDHDGNSWVEPIQAMREVDDSTNGGHGG